jgi:peptide/nickel transport system ATP-binding protein
MRVPLLEIRNLKTHFYTYRGIVKAVDDVNLSLKKGEALGVTGESGCGKSTLAYSILRIVPRPGRIVDGQIFLGDINLTSLSEKEMCKQIRWKRISMIFQGAMNALTPVYTIGDQITEALTWHTNISKEEAIERTRRLLDLVGLEPELFKRYPHELSGGQKQRAFIAMALTLNPDLVIADEPTTALDVVVQAQFLNLLKRLVRDLRISLILITHDLSVIAEMANEIAIMYAGKIAERGSADVIFLEPAHPYTQGLLQSIPRLRTTVWIQSIPGQPPDLINPPLGCRFHPRCQFATDVCRRKEPVETKLSNGHYVSCWLYPPSR